MIVGITGHAKSGKDTFEQFFFKHSRGTYAKLNFADALKEICMIMGFTREQLNDQSLKEKIDVNWGITPRKLMQTIGTEMFREWFGPNVWVKILEMRLNKMKEDNVETIVIGDVRFQTETDFVERIGGYLIKIERDNLDLSLPMYQHDSEKGIDELKFDKNRFIVVKNNGTLDDLEKKAVEFLEKYRK